jgi:H+-transporting ATPase
MGLGIPLLLLMLGILLIGRNVLHLSLAQLQTLSFITLVFSAQGMIYLVREGQPFWNSRPSRWLMLASSVAVLSVILLASVGIMMQPLPLWIVFAVLGVVLLSLLVLDLFKVWVFGRAASRIRPV